MNTLVQAENLVKLFPLRSGFLGRGKGIVHAVENVNFDIEEGTTLGLVGESGCGKTTVGRLSLRLVEPTRGSLRFEGVNILELEKNRLRRLRSKMQIIFQDPFASLNPRQTVRTIISHPLLLHGIVEMDEVEAEVSRLLEAVGLKPASLYLNRFPHEFSGGQRQRIGIAKAIASRPKYIVADEPVSALDMSIRGQILNLLKKLQEEFKIAYLFITHDLSVVRSVTKVVSVMYLGKIVEQSDVEGLFENPLHPYTRALLAATPIPDPERSRNRERVILKGDVPSSINPPPGCRFHPRCPFSNGRCTRMEPEIVEVETKHFAACYRVAQ